MRDTPSNESGQDYAGELTQDATEVAAVILLTIAEYVQQEWSKVSPTLGGSGYLGRLGTRFVVCSNSWGLNPAARWIANTDLDVHALVDWEGPTDSAEALIVTEAYNPYGSISGVVIDPESGTITFPETALLPSTLTIEVFEAWALDNQKSFPHWFRPPHPALIDGGLPADWDEFVRDLAKTYVAETDWWVFDTPGGGRPDPAEVSAFIANMWDERYNGSYPVYDPLGQELADFWEDREALTWLSEVTAKGTAYVRVQGSVDHNQPDHMVQRHAIKALNEAYTGSPSKAFYADGVDYWEDANTHMSDSAQPMVVASLFDITDPDPSTPGAWGNADFWPSVGAEKAWGVQVDLVRWAVETTFV